MFLLMLYPLAWLHVTNVMFRLMIDALDCTSNQTKNMQEREREREREREIGSKLEALDVESMCT
jgi:hypothetical protein